MGSPLQWPVSALSVSRRLCCVMPFPRGVGCAVRAGATEGEVGLPVVPVVPEVQRREVGQAADGALGLVVVIDVDPQRGPAVAGVAVVKREGFRIVDNAGDGAAGLALSCGVAGGVGRGLPAGENPPAG